MTVDVAFMAHNGPSRLSKDRQSLGSGYDANARCEALETYVAFPSFARSAGCNELASGLTIGR
jgi:hypothetical protein